MHCPRCDWNIELPLPSSAAPTMIRTENPERPRRTPRQRSVEVKQEAEEEHPNKRRALDKVNSSIQDKINKLEYISFMLNLIPDLDIFTSVKNANVMVAELMEPKCLFLRLILRIPSYLSAVVTERRP
jgi:hypothetical protein